WNTHKRTIGIEAAYAMSWAELMNLMTEVCCLRNEVQKMETELWNLVVKGNDLTAYTRRFQELVLLCTRMVPNEEDKVERFVGGLPDNIQGNNVARAYTAKNNEKNGPVHFRKYCPKLRNQNHGNKTGNKNGNKTGNQTRGNEATAKAYAIGGGGGENPNSNVVMGMFLLNNCYASMLFDSGADRSFMSSTFSALLDVALSTLDTSYAIELANGRILETNVVFRGCTLGLLGYSFDIDLIPVELGSFDVIIGIDWLAKYHALIVCDENVVCVPYGDEVLIIRGDDCDGKSKSKLNIISCTKTQKYLQKGCQVYLAQFTSKKTEDKSKEKRLEDVPFVWEFLEVFPEDLPGLSPAQQVEFQIDLVPGVAPVVRAPYRLAPAEMPELSTQLQELSDRGFIRPIPHPGELRFCLSKRKIDLFGCVSTTVCKSYLDRFMIIFIDDILVYSKSRKEHEGHLKLIMRLLKKEELYAKFSKCEFWLSKVQFLGHVIDSEGIHVDPTMIEFIKDWASPKTPTEIGQFLEKAEAAFQLVGRGFDAKGEGHSLRIPPTQGLREELYHTRPRAWCSSACPEDVETLSNELKMRQRRWLELLSDYDCEIRYHPRKANVVADALIQKERSKPLRVWALVMTMGLNLPKQILSAQSEARKEENFINEDLHGMINKLEPRADETLFCNFFAMREDDHLEQVDEGQLLEGSSLKAWRASSNRQLTVLEIIQETTKKIVQIKSHIQAARDCKRSYANVRRKPLEFQIGDKVMLKVSPWKGVIRFGKRGKLNPYYIGPFKIIAKVRTVAYHLELPEQLSRVYSTFHVSNWKKCLVGEPLSIPLDEIQIDDQLHFIEEPVKIMDRKVKCLKQSRIQIVKVRWNSRRGPEFTWERQDQMKKKYPHLFLNSAPVAEATS
ncbi:putative reverse transcriptase domain-containing protein, partial [Tanacetum coccineum]